MKKKILSVLLTGALVISVFSACGGNNNSAGETDIKEETEEAEDLNTESEEETEEADSEEDDENYETGDASLDNPRNQDDIGENEILVVSFGTSFNDNRRLTIGAIEDAIEKANPGYSVRRAFTSQIIIDHVYKRDGEKIDNVTEALDRAVDNGVKNLIIQPTHLMDGYEYNDLYNEVAAYSDAFETVKMGSPLLTTDEDFDKVSDSIIKEMEEYDDGKTAIVFMGHGTEADSNGIYEKMQGVLKEKGASNYYIGTVEATPDLDDVVKMVKEGDYEKVVLRPLMVVAGDHANNDMAGDDDDSWLNTFKNEGYDVSVVLKGLGEIEEIRDLYVLHAGEAE